MIPLLVIQEKLWKNFHPLEIKETGILLFWLRKRSKFKIRVLWLFKRSLGNISSIGKKEKD